MKKNYLPFQTFCWFIFVSLIFQACQAHPSTSIAFVSSQDKQDKWYLFMIDISGSNMVQIKTGMAEDGCPVWSPDGERIVFTSTNATGYKYGVDRELNLYMIQKDGSKLKQLTVGKSEIYDVSWSPDGSSFVYSAQDGSLIHLSRMNADGSRIMQLTHSMGRDIFPHWSPDGKRILFSSNPSSVHGENPYFSIFVMNADGNEIKQLTNEEERDYDPAWSPDGKKIAFYAMIEDQEGSRIWDNANIYVMDESGSNKQRITDSPAPVLNISPSWSPDGQSIAFASNRDHLNTPDSFDIYVMNVDGSNVIRLTTSGNNKCPSWQPVRK